MVPMTDESDIPVAGAEPDEASQTALAPVNPHRPNRFVVMWRKIGGGSLGFSILLHAAILLFMASYFIVRQISDKQVDFLPGGGTRSLYGPDGLVAGSERAERWLFWPMGTASAGAMRQWGHHATAFVGRRHFDDADLFDRRFVFPGRLSGFGWGPR